MNKFYDIYLELKKEIETEYYVKGSLLPSENLLSEKYKVSRETIRKSLSLLVENGYIQKQKGKGSIVLDINRHEFPISTLISFKEFQEKKELDVKTKVVKNEIIEAPKFLIDLGFVGEEEKVVYLVRQRIIDGEAVILDKDYIRVNITGKLPTKKIQKSLYDYLENSLKVKICYAKKFFSAEVAKDEDQKLMDLNGDKYLIVVKSDIFTENTEFLHYNETKYRLDKFEFTHFLRRNNN